MRWLAMIDREQLGIDTEVNRILKPACSGESIVNDDVGSAEVFRTGAFNGDVSVRCAQGDVLGQRRGSSFAL
jgi:hypothetical protein